MDTYSDQEMEEFLEEIGDELEDMPTYKTRRTPRSFLKSNRKRLVLGGMGILLLILLVALFFGKRNEPPTEVFTSIQVRLNLIEERLTRLEDLGLRIVSLEKQEEVLRQSLGKIDGYSRLLTQRLDNLTQRVGMVQTRMDSVLGKAAAPRAPQSEPGAAPKKRYHKVRAGETLFRIAQRYRISVDKLCSLNKITPSTVIKPGQELLIAPGSNQ